MASIKILLKKIKKYFSFLEITEKINPFCDDIHVKLFDGSVISIIVYDGIYEMFPIILKIYDEDFDDSLGSYDNVIYENINDVVDKLYYLCGKIQNI